MKNLRQRVGAWVLLSLLMLGEVLERRHPPSVLTRPVIAILLPEIESDTGQHPHTHEAYPAEGDLQSESASTRPPVTRPIDRVPLPSFSILVPAHNEESMAHAFLQILPGLVHNLDAQVVIIDDGSHDGTSAALAVTDDPGISVVTIPEMVGFSEALRTGLSRATRPWVVIGDLYILSNLTSLEPMITALSFGRASFVTLSRFVNSDEKPLLRHRLASLLLRYLYGATVHDPNPEVLLIRREMLDAYSAQIPAGYLGALLLPYLLRKGVPIEEVSMKSCLPPGAANPSLQRALGGIRRLSRAIHGILFPNR